VHIGQVAYDVQVNSDEVRSNVELKVSERLTFGSIFFERLFARMSSTVFDET
jgi:hypothetical protein